MVMMINKPSSMVISNGGIIKYILFFFVGMQSNIFLNSTAMAFKAGHSYNQAAHYDSLKATELKEQVLSSHLQILDTITSQPNGITSYSES
eukprot:CAMPEP_0197316970 /NCGR_PEP_ID=MMETSP0891-20130614/45084_1 /TAXON_ID=44058 ORGANISM="Aureoumbra lagunensis, Strain CCMP1510" /NCGR_SAMPLE_ID=MMETSP0891 /ASSEMBLY_ACC=CAM_ASM_000534 /LENGTH=90 /DNA_ID=CAMNT_0042806721 /DNA_START=42 /DNA_END=311 /DNA_ORIENTATION=-